MRWTEPERLAYSMQLQDMRQEPDNNCKNCFWGKHLGWKVYQCNRTPRGNATKTMQGNVCEKWRV